MSAQSDSFKAEVALPLPVDPQERTGRQRPLLKC